MRRIIGFILLTAAFLGGYHLGRQDNSPDLIGYARQAAVAVAAVATDIHESATDSDGAALDGEADRAGAEDRPGVDPRRDTRAYSRQYPYRESRTDRYAEPAVGASTGEPAVAQAPPDDGRADWAGRIWRAINPPSSDAR